jgi:cytochrome P450
MFQLNTYLLSYTRAIVNSKQHGAIKNIFSTIIAEAEKGEGTLTDLDVQHEAASLIVAGTDTTGTTLTYLTYALLQRPQLRDAIEEEVETLNGDFTDADIENLPLLNAVINETLRLYGAAPGALPRVAPAGGIVLSGFYIPEGVTVTTQSYTLHRNPSIWQDPEKFDHTRWLPGAAHTQAARIGFSPFGSGARTCLGINLAWMELRIAAALLFRECKGLRLAPETTPASMEFENFFLITPISHKCNVML